MLIPILVQLLLASPAQSPTVSGVVVDASGGVIAGAAVVMHGPVPARARSGADGRFSIALAPGRYDMEVSAPGFERWTTGIDVPAPALTVVLEAAAVTERVAVTAARGDTSVLDPAAPISVVARADLDRAASPLVDDVLRTTPGFSLFRRTSSRTANPTAQGATLRGLSASGSSRALVLADGAPLNDPFGGWVYWNRVPLAAIDRVEVVRGASSDLYGADAIGGVIQLFTAQPDDPELRVQLDGDSLGTARSSLFGGWGRGGARLTAAAEASRSDGAYVVAAADRGRIDRKASTDYLTAFASGEIQRPSTWRLRGSVHAFGESRENGTVLQLNDTSARRLQVGASGPLGGGYVELTGQAGDQVYHQSFSSIGTGRATETLTTRQTVPATNITVSSTWRRALGRSDLLLGADLRDTVATNHEIAFAPDGSVRSRTDTAGTERTTGAFGQLRARLGGRTTVIAGVRGDWWQRDRVAGITRAEASPRASVSARAWRAVSFRASVSRAFRVPTLNERLRGFRVGNVVTLANAALVPETVVTTDAGLVAAGRRGSLQLTAFTSRVAHAITNVTVSSTPALITRRRENAGAVRASGLEAEGEWRLAARLVAAGTLTLTRSRFDDTADLTGNRVPQVPRWQAVAAMRYGLRRADLQVQVRGFGAQFEDDRNTLVLRAAAVTDASLAVRLDGTFGLVAAVENLFDVDYDTGRTPTRTIGTPRAVRVGLRIGLR